MVGIAGEMKFKYNYTEEKMEIKKFIIHSYKAIEKDLVVDLSFSFNRLK